jgi:hypothetical protein
MSQQLPEGFVDPYDVGAVSSIFAEMLRLVGVDGVSDLLGRLPGVTQVPGSPRRRFRDVVEPSAWIGPEHNVSMTLPATHQHVVSGVVLQRSSVPAGELPGLLAGLVASLTRAQASHDETSAALTALRDILSAM